MRRPSRLPPSARVRRSSELDCAVADAYARNVRGLSHAGPVVGRDWASQRVSSGLGWFIACLLALDLACPEPKREKEMQWLTPLLILDVNWRPCGFGHGWLLVRACACAWHDGVSRAKLADISAL